MASGAWGFPDYIFFFKCVYFDIGPSVYILTEHDMLVKPWGWVGYWVGHSASARALSAQNWPKQKQQRYGGEESCK